LTTFNSTVAHSFHDLEARDDFPRRIQADGEIAVGRFFHELAEHLRSAEECGQRRTVGGSHLPADFGVALGDSRCANCGGAGDCAQPGHLEKCTTLHQFFSYSSIRCKLFYGLSLAGQPAIPGYYTEPLALCAKVRAYLHPAPIRSGNGCGAGT